MRAPANNLIVQIDSVSREDCDLNSRRKQLTELLSSSGAEAFCYALASLMEVNIIFDRKSTERNGESNQ